MCIYDFSSTFSSEHNYRITKCIRQRWNASRFSYRSSSRPDHGLLFLTRGHIRFDFDRQQLTAHSGDLIFLPKGIHYDACIPPEFGQTEDYLINFDTAHPLHDSLPSHPVKVLHAQTHEIKEHFTRMIRNDQPWQHTDLYTKGQFYILLDSILTQRSTYTDQEMPVLRKAQELLSENNDLNVSDIARICSISESGLRSHFKKAYGVSPQQYRMRTRIERAKYLLEATDLSVRNISEHLGFYDEAYFCKVFCKYTGCSPKKFACKKTI